jgi:hypothetical protein
LDIRLYFHEAPIFYVFANILGKRQFIMILLDFVAANICVYFQYLFMHFVCANIFGAIVLKPRFKIDVVVVVI